MNIYIREAKNEDQDKIVAFQLGMAKETENLILDETILTAGVNAVFNNPSIGKYFVAEANETIVASLMITFEWSDWRNGHVWWIQSVYVDPEFRKKGIYARMYSYLKMIVEKDPAIRGLRLYVDNTNIPAQKVYEALGMNGSHYRVFEWMKS